MPNPNPVMTKEFKERQIKPVGEVPGKYPLGRKQLNLRLPIDVEDYLGKLSKEERVPWIRNLIVTAVRERMENESN